MSLSRRVVLAWVLLLLIGSLVHPVGGGIDPELLERLREGLKAAQIDRQAPRAVEDVAVAVEANRDPVAAVADARTARLAGEKLPEDLRASLDAVCQTAERRALAEALGAARTAPGKGRWATATMDAGKSLARLHDARLDKDRAAESPGFRQRLAESRETLEKVSQFAARAAAVASFEDALAASDRKAERLRAIDREALPAKLARQLDCLRGMAEVKELTSAKWQKPPEVAHVKAAVARFEAGLNDEDAGLGKRLLQELAVKALLDGHPETAMKLLPKGSDDHARKLLADLSALALGQGEVKVLSADRLPEGLLPIVPEAARKTWKAPAKGKGEPSTLERAEKAATAIEAQAKKDAAAESMSADAKAGEAVKAVAALYERVMAPELAERKKLSGVEAELDRRLTPAERVRARALLGEKLTAKQIAERLKPRPADAEKEYLGEVARRMGAPLTDEQAASARRLRKQGRSSAEAAEILQR